MARVSVRYYILLFWRETETPGRVMEEWLDSAAPAPYALTCPPVMEMSALRLEKQIGTSLQPSPLIEPPDSGPGRNLSLSLSTFSPRAAKCVAKWGDEEKV